MNSKWAKYAIAATVVVAGTWSYVNVKASDHDDGSQATAMNNLNLTDLFVFRADNQTGNSADHDKMIFIMDSNGHTPANAQVFFNTNGRYEFHIGRIAASAVNTAPTGTENSTLRFEFGEPDANNHQAITVTFIQDGVTQTVTQPTDGSFTTTSLADGKADQPKSFTLPVNGQSITVFAGLREDPFFFDVEQFLKVRAGALGTTAEVGFLPANQAVDGFAKQNVNSIVVQIPIALLQSSAGEPVFDVWETTSKNN